MKKYLCGFFTAFLLIALAVPSFAENVTRQITADYNINAIFIDGTRFIPRDANGIYIQPFVVDGTTYLPIRSVAEAVGYDVKYNDTTYSVTLTKKTAEVKPSPSPTTNPIDTALQSNLTARVNASLKVANTTYNNLQNTINNYISRGMGRSSACEQYRATQETVKSEILVMQGMLVCIRNAITNDELLQIEKDFAYYESVY